MYINMNERSRNQIIINSVAKAILWYLKLLLFYFYCLLITATVLSGCKLIECKAWQISNILLHTKCLEFRWKKSWKCFKVTPRTVAYAQHLTNNLTSY